MSLLMTLVLLTWRGMLNIIQGIVMCIDLSIETRIENKCVTCVEKKKTN